MIEHIQKEQVRLEGIAVNSQAAVEKAALELLKNDPVLMEHYLTNYCNSHAEYVFNQWIDLGENLICKYNDGYVKDENGRARGVGYPEEWLRKVIKERPQQYKLEVWE